MTRTDGTRVVVIGLDCAEPSLVFDRFAERLPHLTGLRRRGLWGTLRSCDPPITVPAWMSMMSSKDPGTLGYYGFRNRADRSYEKMTTATSLAVREPLLWDYLGDAGRRVILIGVPQTYPPRPVNGLMVTDFLTPSIASNGAWSRSARFVTTSTGKPRVRRERASCRAWLSTPPITGW